MSEIFFEDLKTNLLATFGTKPGMRCNLISYIQEYFDRMWMVRGSAPGTKKTLCMGLEGEQMARLVCDALERDGFLKQNIEMFTGDTFQICEKK